MKKFSKLMSAALMALATFVPAQADELTLFDGTVAGEDAPIYGYNYDSQGYITQTIFPEAELTAMKGTFISSMKFYVASETGNTLSGGKLSISVGTTTETGFSGWSAQPVAGLTHVADITMTKGETEVVVNFDVPFAYNGDNLVFEAVVTETGSWANLAFYGVASETPNVLHKGYSSSSASFLPKTTFEYEALDDFAAVNAQALDFGKVYIDNEATQTITLMNLGKNAFTPVFGALQAPFSLGVAATELAPGASMEIPVKFAPVAEGEYAQTLTIDCGVAGQFEVALTGNSSEMPAEIVVCDGDVTNGSLPIYGYYYDVANSKDQMIYGADMLASLVGKKITAVTFHPNAALPIYDGKIQLSFKVVEQQGFTSYDALTDLTVVATAVPVKGATELTFVLDEPYEYNGGNLAIETLNIETGYYGAVSFYGVNVEGYYPSFYTYGTYQSTDVSTFLPKATFTYAKEEAPEYIRGDVDGDNEVGISDVTALIDILLSGAETPAVTDVDQDGETGIADVTALIDYLLSGVWN